MLWLYLSTHIQAVLVFVLVFLLIYIYVRKDGNIRLPPGPFSLPIVGNLPWLGTDLREPLEKMKRKYGDIFTVYLGSRRVIMLCSYDTIKEAFVKYGNIFIGRPQDLFFIKELTYGLGVYLYYGDVFLK